MFDLCKIALSPTVVILYRKQSMLLSRFGECLMEILGFGVCSDMENVCTFMLHILNDDDVPHACV